MLPRDKRIKTKQFPGVTRGKTTQNELFRMVVKTEEGLRAPKCAVIISNKVAKTAVSRNRIRRQVYAALETLWGRIPVAYVSLFPKKVPMTHQEVIKGLETLI